MQLALFTDVHVYNILTHCTCFDVDLYLSDSSGFFLV